MRGSARWPWLAAAVLLWAVSGATAGTPRLDPAREQLTPPVGTRAAASELDPALQRVAAAADRPTQALQVARAAALHTEDGTVRVILETRAPEATRAAVDSAGGSVEGSYGSLVQALVPPPSLRALARRADVQRVERPAAFTPASVTGEGVAFVGADRAQAAGFDGTGISIAVFDTGFAGYTDRQASGDLPAQLQTRAFCSGGLTGGSGHGTAVAEIVHELAPAAELHLVCIETVVDLGRAKDYAIELGIDVVNMSGGFFNSGDGTGNGTGVFADEPDGIAKDARDNGIVWVNAAGNEARTHWAGGFADPDGDSVHDYAAGDEGNSFTVAAGGSICVYARWQAWQPGAVSDFDLYVTNASGAVVAASDADQTLVEPTEQACFTNGGATQSFSASLVHYAGDASPLIDVFVPGPAPLEYHEPRGSLLEPAASPSVLSVGAVCRLDGLLQPYSSRGRAGGAVKPDLLGPDAVSSATAGAGTSCSTGFAGTSAAAPHVAGVVALLLDEHPGSGAARIEALARAWARDVGAPKEDAETGYGLARLVTDAPTVAVSTAFPAEDGTARAVARLTSAVGGTYRWQYGPSAAYGSETAPAPFAGDPEGVDVSDVLPFVSIGTFHARVVATTAFGTTFGPDEVFAAPAGPPTVATRPPGPVSAVGATLSATASANGSLTRVDFELGTTAAYGTTVPGASVGLGRGVTVSTPAADLRPGTTYHYRAVATNALGQVTYGRGAVFTTAPDLSVIPGGVSVFGTPAVGGILSASTGGWSRLSPHSAPPALTYQWSQCRAGGALCAPITGAVGSTYAVRNEDVGKSLRLAVTGTVPWNALTVATPPTSAVIAPGGGAGSGGGPGGAAGSGGGGGGGSGGAPDVEVTVTASTTTPVPNQAVEVRVAVLNKDAIVGATGLTATIALPPDARLLGAPAYDRGSGCTGTRTLVCYLDYLPGRATTVVRFTIDVGGAGEKAVSAQLALNVWEPDTANNAAGLTLRVTAPSVAGGLTGSPASLRGRTLVGGARADGLRGTAGPDRLSGLGGNDRLYGGKGRDRLDGGSGDDSIFAVDGVRDVVRCGTGRDRVSADRADTVARDCESVSRR